MQPDRPAHRTRIRTLLVDDSALVRDGLLRYLKGGGLVTVVGVAANGREALDKLETLKPDLVIMDIHMPEMNGLEATRRIKARPNPPRVLVVSTEAGPAIRAALEAGADGFCDKQDLPEQLNGQIQGLFSDAGAA